MKSVAANKAECKGNPEKIRALRLGEVRRVLRHRWGHELPDDDAGRDDLELLLDIVSLARDARRRMKNIIETWAPWMDTAESYELVENILSRMFTVSGSTTPSAKRSRMRSPARTRPNIEWLNAMSLTNSTDPPFPCSAPELVNRVAMTLASRQQ
jgi:hypothetical protein